MSRGDVWMTVGQASSRWSLIKQLISDDLDWGYKLRGTMTDMIHPKHLIIFLPLHLSFVGPYIITLCVMFHWNVQDPRINLLIVVQVLLLPLWLILSITLHVCYKTTISYDQSINQYSFNERHVKTQATIEWT